MRSELEDSLLNFLKSAPRPSHAVGEFVQSSIGVALWFERYRRWWDGVWEFIEERNLNVTEITIDDLATDFYSLQQPITINISVELDSIFARFPEVEAIGWAANEHLAIRNLKQDIVDLYIDLRDSDPNILGEIRKKQLRILKGLIRENYGK